MPTSEPFPRWVLRRGPDDSLHALPAMLLMDPAAATAERVLMDPKDVTIARGHEARIDCPACQPIVMRNSPLDTPLYSHREPTWPGARPDARLD